MASSPDSHILTKPRIKYPIIKICFEIYHALKPFHHKEDPHYPDIKRSAVWLFFVALRWYFYLKRLVKDKIALNTPFTIRERIALSIAILGHLLMIWAQKSTLQHETNLGNEHIINESGPFSIIRHPHHLGKWISEAFVAIYQDNKLSMSISVVTLGLTVNRTTKEEEECENQHCYEEYKKKVTHKFIPGIY
eukprot:124878_1